MKRILYALIFAVLLCVMMSGCKSETLPEDAYYLVIGEDDIAYVEVSTSKNSGGVVHADGSSFKKGEKVWLEQFDRLTDLRGVIVNAVDTKGNAVYSFSVPEGATEAEILRLLESDCWLVAPTKTLN